MSKPATVLYLDYTNGIGLGGGQRSLALLVRHLDRARYRPVVACPEGERLRELLPAGTPVFAIPLDARLRSVSRYESGWEKLPGALPSVWRAARAVREIAVREQAALVHANNLKMLWLAAMATGRRLPLVWHVRDIFPAGGLAKTALRVAESLATRILAVSEAVRGQFTSPKACVLHNAVELPDLGEAPRAREAFRRRHGIPQEATLVCCAGRLIPGKGIDSLLEAAARLREGFPLLRLAVVGEGPDLGRLRALAAALRLEEAVHFIPFQADMARVWPAVDLAAVPSVEPDSFPRSVIEAMSFGKPVAGSRIGGIAEAFEDGITGLCFRPGDAEELASRMRGLLEQPQRLAHMGRAARRRCEERFSVEAQACRLSEIYASLLRSRAREAA